jgi:CBS-domain-containing membrane protein
VSRAHDLQHVAQLFERLRLGRLARPLPPVALWAAYVFANGFLSIALLAVLAVAAALSLAGTATLMILLDASHPPAGATTLIVSLGIINRLPYLAVIEAAVLVITLQAFCVHRLAGLAYPVWSVPKPAGRYHSP